VDQDVIRQKLESLRRCVGRVADKCPAAAATLAADPDLQDIVTLNLSRAIQLCVDVGAHLITSLDLPAPTTMGQTFELIGRAGVVPVQLAARLQRAVGFRNIVIHNYEAIDWQLVHSLARDHLGDFTDFARAVSEDLRRRGMAL
jgi:uncharacterized protein YutE (UPF0331/DUF86 family)